LLRGLLPSKSTLIYDPRKPPVATAGHGRIDTQVDRWIRVITAGKTTRFASVSEFVHRYVPGSLVGPATAHLSAGNKDTILADLETELSPWVDERGLTFATEVNTGVARK